MLIVGDLIDREQLMEELYKDINCKKTRFLNCVRFAPAVNRWIPCNERLPEKAGEYLCTLYYAIPPYNLFHPELDHYIRTVSVQRFDGKSFIASVIAWMPNPEPYGTNGDVNNV